MNARKNTPSTSLFREAFHAELRSARYASRHAARRATTKRSRWAMGVAAAAAVGAIAATAGTASWGNAATSLAADDHAVAASQHTPASGSHLELTSRNLAPKPAAPLSADASGHGATVAKPATAPKPAAKAAKPAVASDVAAKRHAAAAHEAALRHTAAVHHAAAAKQHAAAQPATIYDSVTPGAIPAGKSVATYADGPFQASTGAVAGRGKVLWIDTDGSNPRADALDVEPGDATPAGAAAWVKAKLAKDPSSNAIVYTFRAAWPKVIAKIGELPQSMQSHVKYWIADPNGTPHIVPGAAATQWYWGKNYDITMAAPGFFRS